MSSLRSEVRLGAVFAATKCMAGLVTGWMHTLDSKIVRADPLCDPVTIGFRGPVIFLLWHEYILLPSFTRQHCNIVMLVSRSGDADWLVGLGKQFGYESVRGSSRRGGSEAILKLVKQVKGRSIVITPDGPQGPRRELASGCIYLASLLGIPLVPIGTGYDRPWRFKKAWDQFAVPRPGSRVRAVLDPAIHIPKKIDRDQVEEYRLFVQKRMDVLTIEAEQWASSTYRRVGEAPFIPGKPESLLP